MSFVKLISFKFHFLYLYGDDHPARPQAKSLHGGGRCWRSAHLTQPCCDFFIQRYDTNINFPQARLLFSNSSIQIVYFPSVYLIQKKGWYRWSQMKMIILKLFENIFELYGIFAQLYMILITTSQLVRFEKVNSAEWYYLSMLMKYII